MSLAEVGFIFSGTYIASVIFEYPTGIFADRYGRKLSLIMSKLTNLVALLFMIYSHSIKGFFIASFLLGISRSFRSGALEALVYDSLKERKMEKLNPQALGSIDMILAVGGILAGIIGPYFFQISAALPLRLTFLASIPSLFFMLFIKEPEYKGKGRINPWKAFSAGLHLCLKNKVLLSVLLLYVPLFFFEGAWYTVQQPALVGLGFPLVLLGIYIALGEGISALGGMTLPKLLNKFNHKTLLLGAVLIEFLVWLVLGTNSLYAVIIFAYILVLVHQFWNYLEADIIHKHIPSNIRATTISAQRMLISLVWVFNPWLMGFLVNSFDRNVLFPIFGVAVLLLAGAVFFLRKRHF